MQPSTERVQLEEGERVLLVVRKHWFILLRDLFVPVLVLIVPLSVYLFAGDSLERHAMFASLPQAKATLLFFVSLLGLISWMAIFFMWTDYYLDVWTITDHRIIAIDQRGFFRRTIASFRYGRLQDIEVRIDGLVPTMLDFGDIHAETAGHESDFKMPGAPNPREIKRLILEAADKSLPERGSVRPDKKPEHTETGGV